MKKKNCNCFDYDDRKGDIRIIRLFWFLLGFLAGFGLCNLIYYIL